MGLSSGMATIPVGKLIKAVGYLMEEGEFKI